MKNESIRRKAVLALVVSLVITTSAVAYGMPQDKSLYDRLGGYNALALVVDDFIVRLVTDKQFKNSS